MLNAVFYFEFECFQDVFSTRFQLRHECGAENLIVQPLLLEGQECTLALTAQARPNQIDSMQSEPVD